jgi:hypothetical protein
VRLAAILTFIFVKGRVGHLLDLFRFRLLVLIQFILSLLFCVLVCLLL